MSSSILIGIIVDHEINRCDVPALLLDLAKGRKRNSNCNFTPPFSTC